MDDVKTLFLNKNQVTILYSQSVTTFAFPLLFGLLLYYYLGEIVVRDNLRIWITVLILFTCARYYLLWRYRKSDITADNVDIWLFIFIAGVFISGIIWGLAPVILIPYQPDNLLEYTFYNGLVILLICGLVTGAGIAYSVNLLVMCAYSLPALLLPALYLVTLGDGLNSVLGSYVFIYFVFVNISVIRLNRQYKYYLNLEYKYELASTRLEQMYDEGNHQNDDTGHS